MSLTKPAIGLDYFGEPVSSENLHDKSTCGADVNVLPSGQPSKYIWIVDLCENLSPK
jgi:hypothetical protein